MDGGSHEGADLTAPVAYTHLDVYKRQDMASVQIAHGGDENDTAAPAQGGAQIGDGGVDLHELLENGGARKRK